ncbi:MAG: DUF1127 domain-containing protein [Pararhodobacter sp.]|nr:DUF1127 domain-containing protein [Pararhodobacter sp.]
MTVLTANCPAAPRSSPSFWTRLRTASALARQRHALACMDDDMLRDIGLTRSQAMTEARRPFWDAPRHWRA